MESSFPLITLLMFRYCVLLVFLCVTRIFNTSRKVIIFICNPAPRTAVFNIFHAFSSQPLAISKKVLIFAVHFTENVTWSEITFDFGEMAEWSNAAVLKTVDLNGSGGSNPSLSANKLKLSALRWAFFVQGRQEPRSCKALHGKSPKGRRPLSFNLFNAAPPRRRRGMWRTQCGKSRNGGHHKRGLRGCRKSARRDAATPDSVTY